MNHDAHEKLCDAMAILTQAHYQVASLADAFWRTGNERMEAEMRELSRDLKKAHELVRAGTGEAISNMVRSTEQSTANMIGAALAVASHKPVQ
jgi:hypothetical protein